jgi:hemoglobin
LGHNGRIRRVLRLAAVPVLVTAALLAGCAGPGPRGEPSLYARLGGAPVVARLTDRYVDALATDPRTRRTFDRVNLRRVKDKLGAYLCQSTGGGCLYDDDDMRTVHAGMHIREAEFYAAVELLQALMDAERVPLRERNELLAILAPTKRDVVER